MNGRFLKFERAGASREVDGPQEKTLYAVHAKPEKFSDCRERGKTSRQQKRRKRDTDHNQRCDLHVMGTPEAKDKEQVTETGPEELAEKLSRLQGQSRPADEKDSRDTLNV